MCLLLVVVFNGYILAVLRLILRLIPQLEQLLLTLSFIHEFWP